MNRFKLELRNVNIVCATAVSALFILINFCVWCAVGSPVYILRFVAAQVAVLPLWLFGLLDFVAFAALGFALGAALGVRCSAQEVSKYRGAFYFIMGVTLAFLHHAVFFAGARMFGALLLSALSCAFVGIGTVNFCRVSRVAALLSAVGALWVLYIFVVNLLTFFFV